MYQGGQPLKSGTVVITVSTDDNSFRQSVLVPLMNGVFQSEDPAFFAIRANMEVDISADVNAQGTRRTVAIHLGPQSPVDKFVLGYGLVASHPGAFGGLFSRVYGQEDEVEKSDQPSFFRTSSSRCFWLYRSSHRCSSIQIFPTAMYKMIGAPAGLLNTHTPSQDRGSDAVGSEHRRILSYEAPKPGALPATDGNALREVPGRRARPELTAASGPTGEAGDQGQPAGTGTQNSRVAELEKAELKPPVAVVEGGLVIPLYVIILSVIGGAINMTRKVPRLQGQGEESTYTTGRPVSNLGSFAMAKFGLKASAAEGTATEPADERPLEDRADDIEKKLTPLITDQVMRKADSEQAIADIRSLVSDMQDLYNARKAGEPLLRFNSFEDWTVSHPRLGELLGGSWRVELLNQYMYLISAPFLAIVTYYVLDLLGLSKQGVVVVLSFSVGLISEKIVSWILGIATGYVSSDPKKA